MRPSGLRLPPRAQAGLPLLQIRPTQIPAFPLLCGSRTSCWSLMMWSTHPNLFLLSSPRMSSIVSRRRGRRSLPTSAGWTARSWRRPRRSLSSWRETGLYAVLTAPGLHLFIWWRRRTAAGSPAAIFGGSTLLRSRILTRCRICSTSPTSPPAALSSPR